MQRKLIFTGLLFLSLASSGQTKKDDDVALMIEVFSFLQDRDKVEIPGRKPEAELLFFDIDSSGKVSNVHLFLEEGKIDVSYTILKELRPCDLNKLTFLTWKNKVVILPVITFSEHSPSQDYISKINWAMPRKSEQGQTVMIMPVFYRMPEYSDRNYLPPAHGSIPDTVKPRQKRNLWALE